MAPTSLPRLAGRVPQRWRRRVPMRLRNALVARFGHPGQRFDPAAHPARLNLGCGYDTREGYLNVDLQDFHGPDLVGDVRSLPTLPSGRYTEIVAQDVLEHLERADGPVALAEWRRLAAPGALLRLRVPDLPSLLRWLREKDDSEHQRRVLHHMFGTLHFGPIVTALRETGYTGSASIEPFIYIPDGATCAARNIGYMRGVMEALS